MAHARNGRGRQGPHRRDEPSEDGFVCRNCNMYVPADPSVAGVYNRNHCPFCLCSRHLDSRVAGDRRSACRAVMRPIGLTTKRTRDKYGDARSGELMLIHRCTICAKVVLNRIAADDDVGKLLDLLDTPVAEEDAEALRREESEPLGPGDRELVQQRLLGAGVQLPEFLTRRRS